MNDVNNERRKPTKKVRRTLSFLGRPVDSFHGAGDSGMVRRPARISGPYFDINVNAYRLVVFDGNKRKSVRCETLEEAQKFKAEMSFTLQESDIALYPIIDEFLAEKRKKGLKEVSVRTLDYKLRYFLPNEVLSAFTPELAQKLYEVETERITRFHRVTRAQTHHLTLRMAKLFFRWVVEHKYLRANPFEKVRPVGKAHAGKQQLRIDEARHLTQVLVTAAQADEEGAIAAFCQLVLGLRSSEVLERQVRDLDDDGRVLWIPCGKTDNARRRLEVPEALRVFLLRLAAGQRPERLLFGGDRTRPHFQIWLWKQVKKYCRLAQLPRVCPHSLRGLHSTLAVSAGCTSGAVASALGHGSFAITAKHYVDRDTLRNSTVRCVADALSGEVRAQVEDTDGLLDRLRALSPDARGALLRAVEGEKAF